MVFGALFGGKAKAKESKAEKLLRQINEKAIPALDALSTPSSPLLQAFMSELEPGIIDQQINSARTFAIQNARERARGGKGFIDDERRDELFARAFFQNAHTAKQQARLEARKYLENVSQIAMGGAGQNAAAGAQRSMANAEAHREAINGLFSIFGQGLNRGANAGWFGNIGSTLMGG